MQTSERLRSLGLLTAGVAHEINNPLEGITNYLKLLRRPDAAEADRVRYVDRVQHGFTRIQQIVGDLLRFARPRIGDGQADLREVIRRAVSVAQYSQPMKGVEVDVDEPSGPVVVFGDAGRLEQVLLNLLLNAGRAMAGTGRVQVLVEQNPTDVLVRVRDEGSGIPEEDLGRIFDPFFTRSEGTGLGLAVSYGLVRAHGGSLTAANRPEGGAEFVIRLPRQQTVRAADPTTGVSS